jgi:hypothetical protein
MFALVLDVLVLGAFLRLNAFALDVNGPVVDLIYACALVAAGALELVVMLLAVDIQGSGAGLHRALLGGVAEVVNGHVLVFIGQVALGLDLLGLQDGSAVLVKGDLVQAVEHFADRVKAVFLALDGLDFTGCQLAVGIRIEPVRLVVVVRLRIYVLAGNRLEPAGGQPALVLGAVIQVGAAGGFRAGLRIPVEFRNAVLVKAVFAAIDFLALRVLYLLAVGVKVEVIAVALAVVVVLLRLGFQIFPSGCHPAAVLQAAVVQPLLPGVIVGQHLAVLVDPAGHHVSLLVEDELRISRGCGQGGGAHAVAGTGFLHGLAVGLQVIPPGVRLAVAAVLIFNLAPLVGDHGARRVHIVVVVVHLHDLAFRHVAVLVQVKPAVAGLFENIGGLAPVVVVVNPLSVFLSPAGGGEGNHCASKRERSRRTWNQQQLHVLSHHLFSPFTFILLVVPFDKTNLHYGVTPRSMEFRKR